WVASGEKIPLLLILISTVVSGYLLWQANKDLELPGQGTGDLGRVADPASAGASTDGPLTGNALSGDPKFVTSTNAAASKTGDFSGAWHSGVGRFSSPREIRLSQSGTQVTGSCSFVYGGRTYGGSIEGTVTGDTLKFRWSGPEGRKGEGVFTLGADG